MRKVTAIVEGANDTIRTLRVMFHAEKLGLYDVDEIKNKLKSDVMVIANFFLPMAEGFYCLEEENKIESLKDDGNINTSYIFFSLNTMDETKAAHLYDAETIGEGREEHNVTNTPYISYEDFLKLKTPDSFHNLMQSLNTPINITSTLH